MVLGLLLLLLTPRSDDVTELLVPRLGNATDEELHARASLSFAENLQEYWENWCSASDGSPQSFSATAEQQMLPFLGDVIGRDDVNYLDSTLVALRPLHTKRATYQRCFLELLFRTLGHDLAHALFDPDVFPEYVARENNPSNGSGLAAIKESLWRSPVVGGKHNSTDFLFDFDDPAKVLVEAKWVLSIGLGRLYWDEEMADTYELLVLNRADRDESDRQSALVARAAWNRTLVKVFQSYVDQLDHAVLLAQGLTESVVLAVTQNASQRLFDCLALGEDSQRSTFSPPAQLPWETMVRSSVILQLLARTNVRQPHCVAVANLTQRLSLVVSWVFAVIENRRPAKIWDQHGINADRENINLVMEDFESRGGWMHESSRYWAHDAALLSSSFTPPVSCTSMHRLADDAAGGPPLCNVEYLQSATPSMAQWMPSTGSKGTLTAKTAAHSHRVVVAASHHKPAWEAVLCHQMNGYAALLHPNEVATATETAHGFGGHRLSFLTELDCALLNWMPPPFMWSASSAIETGLGFACLSGTTQKNNRGAVRTLRVADLRAVVEQDSDEGKKPAIGSLLSYHPDRPRSTTLSRPKVNRLSAFDEMTVLSMNLGEDAHRALDSWFSSDLTALAAQLQLDANTSLTTLLPVRLASQQTFFTTSMLVQTTHLMPNHIPPQRPLNLTDSVWRETLSGVALFTRHSLLTYGLGMLTVSSDSDVSCEDCTQTVHVDAHYFLKSEVWTALRTQEKHIAAERRARMLVEKPAQLSPHGLPVVPFAVYALERARDVLGSPWLRALYDEGVAASLLTDQAGTLVEEEYSTVVPALPELLLQLRRQLSWSVWCFLHDEELARVYNEVSPFSRSFSLEAGSVLAWHAFNAALEKTIRGFGGLLRGALQFAFDTLQSGDRLRTSLQQAARHGAPDERELGDPLVRIMGAITGTTSHSQVEQLLQLQMAPIATASDIGVGNSSVSPPPLFFVDYEDGGREYSRTSQSPYGGLLWRSYAGRVLTCSKVARLGATGNVCNDDYIVQAPRELREWLTTNRTQCSRSSNVSFLHTLLHIRVNDDNRANAVDFSGTSETSSLCESAVGELFRSHLKYALQVDGSWWCTNAMETGKTVTVTAEEAAMAENEIVARSIRRYGAEAKRVHLPSFDRVSLLHLHTEDAEGSDCAMLASWSRGEHERRQHQWRSRSPSVKEVSTASMVTIFSALPSSGVNSDVRSWLALQRALLMATIGYLSFEVNGLYTSPVERFDYVHTNYFIKSEVWSTKL